MSAKTMAINITTLSILPVIVVFMSYRFIKTQQMIFIQSKVNDVLRMELQQTLQILPIPVIIYNEEKETILFENEELINLK